MTYRLDPFVCAASCLLALFMIPGCSDDDGGDAGDGGMDGGALTDGGRAGTSGGPKAGSGGSSGGAGSRADSGAAGAGEDEDGGTMPGDAGGADSGAGMDGGAAGTTANGGAGGSSAGAGGAAGSGGTGAVAGCEGLMDCCEALSPPERMSCELVAANAEDAMCDQFKPLFCTTPDTNEEACMMLADCCESLPRGPLRLACATTAMDGMPLACQQGLLAFCPMGGDPNACESLATCCASRPPPQRPGCNAIVDQGVPSTCELIEAALCP